MNRETVTPTLAIAALGVVFGDIGTSPLYAMREALGDLPIGSISVLGALSLVFWSLILVISIKYMCIVFRADNDGEGGILALLALLRQTQSKYKNQFYLLAIFGAGLLIGDGMLTPAISVISAIEGLKVASPVFNDAIVPLSCGILIVLFFFQRFGTAHIGRAFGPVLLVWFLVIAVLGLLQIAKHPAVLKAVNPWYGFEFLRTFGYQGYLLLGGVFLVVTGGEALYADIGHFGKNPIRYSWFVIALPCLLLNYFGQGALLLSQPEAMENPFYHMAPEGFLIPLLVIATLATIIASQAVISATFSLMKQAVLLGLYPRIQIIQTSKEHQGQIYIPQMNLFLLMGTLLLILTFRSSSGLAHAYGIAVNLDMLLMTLLVGWAARTIWHWSMWRIVILFTPLFVVDAAFLGANSHKFLTGGWTPILFACFLALVMHTWNMGLMYLKNNFYMRKEGIAKIVRQLHYKSLTRLEGVTAIFITDVYDNSGGSFLHFLKLSRALPENILIVNYTVENIPHVHYSRRFEVHYLDEKICQLTLHYGFMDTVSIPSALELANERGLLPFQVNVDAATWLVEVPNVVASRSQATLRFHWQEKLFAFLMRNYSANLNIEFYQLPFNRTIAIGTYCII